MKKRKPARFFIFGAQKMLPMLAVLLFFFPFFESQKAVAFPTEKAAPTELVLEPQNWWVGMKTKSVSLLVRGENAGLFEAKISKKRGVRLLKTERGDSPNYLFLEIEIGQKAMAGEIKIQLFRSQKLEKTVVWLLFEREKGSANRTGFDSKDVIYLLVPDRFANGDASNDSPILMKEKADRSTACGRHGGDIEGIRQHLDYIKNMGFSAIWATPLLENDMARTSYHGYAITDFYRIDPRFGSLDEMKKLCREGREKGLKTIMDMVVNHCGSENWMAKDPPFRDWLNGETGVFRQSNHRKTLWQDPHGAAIDRRNLGDGWFDRSMPDLNQRNPFLAKYLIQNAIWWAETLQLEGIRMDTWPYPDQDFLIEWTRRLLLEYPKMGIVGEFWHDQPALVAAWQKGAANSGGFQSELPSVFDFPLQIAMQKALVEPEGWDSGFGRLYEMQAMDFLYPAPEKLVVLTSNHDMNRLFTMLGEDAQLFEMAMAFVLTTRGIPQLFYGDEILMKSPKERDDCALRGDMPGGWAGDAVNVFEGKGLMKEQVASQLFLKKLLNWRKSATAIHAGKLLHFAPENGFLVHFRTDERQRVMVVLNKNQERKSLVLDRFTEGLAGAKRARNVVTGEVFELGKTLEVARGALILEVF